MNIPSVVVDVDSSDLVKCILGDHMVIVVVILMVLSSSGTIGKYEIEVITFTIFYSAFKANELTNRPRLEPLLKDRGFIWKFKPNTVFSVVIYANNL